MQLTAPLKVLILNGPGIPDLLRTLPLIAHPHDKPLEWTMVTNDESRNYLQIRPHGYNLADHGNPLRVVGRIISWGFPDRNPHHSQGKYHRYNIVLEMKHVDDQWYYYVGDYLRDVTDRFGEGMIYTAEQYAAISTTCPREDPPPRINQGDNVSIITTVKQKPMVL